MPGDNIIVDFHTHVFPPWLAEQREGYVAIDAAFGELYDDTKARMATVDDLIRVMDEDGVNVSVVMGIGWTDIGLARDVNDYIIESAKAHPDRIVGFAGVNPAWGDDAAKEADRCAKAGLRGVGELHPDSQRFDLGDSKVMAPLMEAVAERDLIVTTHASEPVGHLYQGKGHTTPDVLLRFIGSFPDARIVCAHWGGGLPFYALMPEVAESLANVWFDTAASPYLYTPQVFKTVSNLVGMDKILLGSDYGLIRPRRLLSQLSESGMQESDMRKIVGENAKVLLGTSDN